MKKTSWYCPSFSPGIAAKLVSAYTRLSGKCGLADHCLSCQGKCSSPSEIPKAGGSGPTWAAENHSKSNSFFTYPPVIKHGNGKSHVNRCFNGKIIHKWWIFHCHAWLPKGKTDETLRKRHEHGEQWPTGCCPSPTIQTNCRASRMIPTCVAKTNLLATRPTDVYT